MEKNKQDKLHLKMQNGGIAQDHEDIPYLQWYHILMNPSYIESVKWEMYST